MRWLRNKSRGATATVRSLAHRPERYHRYPPLPYPRWHVSDNMTSRRGHNASGTALPPLPNILSGTINQQVFTHRSFHGRPTHVFEDHPNDLSPDNERLEYLGDAVLSLIATKLLMEMYPGLHVGPLTKIKSMLVGNTTLAEISRRYKLPDRLVLQPAQAVTLRASYNVQADVFEAFVGGLYKDQGESVVRDWLVRLLRPYAAEAYVMVRAQHGLSDPVPLLPTPTSSPPPLSPSSSYSAALSGDTPTISPTPVPSSASPLALFNQHISKMNRHVEWAYADGTMNRLEDALAAIHLEDRQRGVSPTSNGQNTRGRNRKSALEVLMVRSSRSTPVWLARVFVDGECFGVGRGNTKKIARNEAAKQGLQKLGVSLDR